MDFFSKNIKLKKLWKSILLSDDKFTVKYSNIFSGIAAKAVAVCQSIDYAQVAPLIGYQLIQDREGRRRDGRGSGRILATRVRRVGLSDEPLAIVIVGAVIILSADSARLLFSWPTVTAFFASHHARTNLFSSHLIYGSPYGNRVCQQLAESRRILHFYKMNVKYITHLSSFLFSRVYPFHF